MAQPFKEIGTTSTGHSVYRLGTEFHRQNLFPCTVPSIPLASISVARATTTLVQTPTLVRIPTIVHAVTSVAQVSTIPTVARLSTVPTAARLSTVPTGARVLTIPKVARVSIAPTVARVSIAPTVAGITPPVRTSPSLPSVHFTVHPFPLPEPPPTRTEPHVEDNRLDSLLAKFPELLDAPVSHKSFNNFTEKLRYAAEREREKTIAQLNPVWLPPLYPPIDATYQQNFGLLKKNANENFYPDPWLSPATSPGLDIVGCDGIHVNDIMYKMNMDDDLEHPKMAMVDPNKVMSLSAPSLPILAERDPNKDNMPRKVKMDVKQLLHEAIEMRQLNTSLVKARPVRKTRARVATKKKETPISCFGRIHGQAKIHHTNGKPEAYSAKLRDEHIQTIKNSKKTQKKIPAAQKDSKKSEITKKIHNENERLRRIIQQLNLKELESVLPFSAVKRAKNTTLREAQAYICTLHQDLQTLMTELERLRQEKAEKLGKRKDLQIYGDMFDNRLFT